MEIQKHNPYCKLIGVTIDNKQFVFGQTNEGADPGLEVYYQKDNRDKGFYYSRRFTGSQLPSMYNALSIYLTKLIPYCPAGHKLTLEKSEYSELIVLFNTIAA